MTAVYGILHLLVDGMCALAMFGRFLPRGNRPFSILIYNFCAFALQMPLGVALDMLWREKGGRRQDFSFLFAAAGVFCTIAGVFAHPAVLGIGNALFHVGGGVGTIREDVLGARRGKGLGVFVAPGALGLYLGTLAGKGGFWQPWAMVAGGLMVLLCAWPGYCLTRKNGAREEYALYWGGKKEPPGEKDMRSVMLCCFLVVILRSYVGMAVRFPWKSGIPAGLLAVLAIVGGKTAGGFAAARYGFVRAVAVSLGLSAVCFLFSAAMPAGLWALFLYNMTMPVTLYWMVCCMPQMPGFAFGFLTFALFLGFVPGYFGLLPESGGNLLGCAGSAVSLLLLAAGYLGQGGGKRDF
ncbi:MAG: MFS transporter [Lachnospiraceae bacterium]|nr:MFS transporter [Lachnospiraceae bacterium]